MRTLAALLALAFLSTSAPAASAPPGPDKDAPVVPPVEKVRQGLDRVVTLKIDRQSLSTAVAMLREKTKLNIVLDTQAIQQLGFTPEQPPTPLQVDVKEVKAKAALRAMLDPFGLTYAVIGDTVVVTTEDMAAVRQMQQHVSIHLDKVEFAVALKQIAHETAVNLTLDPRVETDAATKVSLQLEDAPLETAVRLLSEMAGLKPVRVGNTLFVTRKEVANEMRAEDGSGERQTGFLLGDMDEMVNVRMCRLRCGRVASLPASVTVEVTQPVRVKAVEENPPDVPEKKDGDK